MDIHWISIGCSLNIHWIFIQYSLNIHWIFIEYSLDMHSIGILWIPMESYGILWNPMYSYGCLGNPSRRAKRAGESLGFGICAKGESLKNSLPGAARGGNFLFPKFKLFETSWNNLKSSRGPELNFNYELLKFGKRIWNPGSPRNLLLLSNSLSPFPIISYPFISRLSFVIWSFISRS